jgi:hypothetical protein
MTATGASLPQPEQKAASSPGAAITMLELIFA